MTVTLPRDYNAAVDFVDRHVAEGRGDKRRLRRRRAVASPTPALAERVDRAGNALRDARASSTEQRVALVHARHGRLPVASSGAPSRSAPSPSRSTRCSRRTTTRFMLRDSRARVLVVSDALLDEGRAGRRRARRSCEHVVVDDGEPARRRSLAARLARARRRADVPPTTSRSGSTRRARPGRRRAPSTSTRTSCRRRTLYGARRPRHPRGRRRLLGREALLRLRPRQRDDLSAARRRHRGAHGRAPHARRGHAHA